MYLTGYLGPPGGGEIALASLEEGRKGRAQLLYSSTSSY